MTILIKRSYCNCRNDHRLGAEAPPAIISVFIGEQLTKVLAELEGAGKIISRRKKI
jgi:glutamine synthetase